MIENNIRKCSRLIARFAVAGTALFTPAKWGFGDGSSVATALATSVRTQTVQIQAIAIDPAVARLSTEVLIDRLQDEDQKRVSGPNGSSHIEQPVFVGEFMPVDAPMRYGYEQGRLAEPRSQVMTEIISRGIAALPVLLEHLSDARPTHVTATGPDIGIVGFGDNFEARYPDPARQPPGVNTVDAMGKNHLSPHAVYIFKVGDLCYGAIGQIVNRDLRTGSSRSGHVETINSPILYPALVAAARSDWSGLSAKEHESILRDDAFRTDGQGLRTIHAWSAIPRLLFYYPDAGREVVKILLARTLIDYGPAHPIPAANEVPDYYQVELVSELAPFQWEDLDRELFSVYTAATEQHLKRALDGVTRDRLALACAKRIAGQGHDEEFKQFFAKEITGMEKLRTYGAEVGALTKEIEHYRAFIHTLNGP